MIRNKKIITTFSFLAMFFLGVGSTIIGAASKNIGLTPQQIGLLIAIQNVGFIFSVIVSGMLADRFSKTKLMFMSSFILAAAFYFYYFKSAFLFNCSVMLFIGVGIGGYEGVADAMLLDMYQKRESLIITINHFFVTFGGLLITIYLIFLQINWRKGIVQSALFVFFLAIVFALARVKSKSVKADSLKVRLRFLFRQKPVLILFILASAAVGIELSTLGILTTFLMDLRGFDQVTSKLGLVTFLSGIACGRLILGFVAKKDQLLNFIAFWFGVVALCTSVLYSIHLGNTLTYLFLFLAGVAISVLFPLIISVSGIHYATSKGMIMGMVKLGVPTGGILMPFFISLMSKYGSFEKALLLFPIIGVFGFAVAIMNRNTFKASSSH